MKDFVGTLLRDPELRKAVRDKIVSGSRRPSKYFGVFDLWRRDYESKNRTKADLARKWSCDSKSIDRGLYALGLASNPTAFSDKVVEDWIRMYFEEDVSTAEVADRVDENVTAGTVNDAVSPVIDRFLRIVLFQLWGDGIESDHDLSKEEIEELKSGSNDPRKRSDKKTAKSVEKRWRRKNGEMGPNGRNVTARVKETAQVT